MLNKKEQQGSQHWGVFKVTCHCQGHPSFHRSRLSLVQTLLSLPPFGSWKSCSNMEQMLYPSSLNWVCLAGVQHPVSASCCWGAFLKLEGLLRTRQAGNPEELSTNQPVTNRSGVLIPQLSSPSNGITEECELHCFLEFSSGFELQSPLSGRYFVMYPLLASSSSVVLPHSLLEFPFEWTLCSPLLAQELLLGEPSLSRMSLSLCNFLHSTFCWGPLGTCHISL